MCTVSWLHDAKRYQVFCNRDEKRTRRQAFSPQPGVRDGVRYLAPVDGDFGGTWIGTNEFGITVCLLNGIGKRPLGYTSRGHLVLDMMAARSTQEVCDRMRSAELDRFAPFTVAALERGGNAALVEWNGVECSSAAADEVALLTSSSFDPDGARARRRSAFHRHVDHGHGAPALLAFHASHGAGPDAYSTCMHRADAETVSFSWITVSESQAEFFYTPQAPCKHAGAEFGAL